MNTNNTPINPKKDQHPLLILKLPGNLTGDLWHFGAAIALYYGVQIPVIEATPITAVSVIEYTWLPDEEKVKAARALTDQEEKKKALSKSGEYVVSHYLKRGIVSFDYLRSIGVPTLLVRLAQLTATSNIDEQSYVKVSGDYVVHLLQVMKNNQQKSWVEIYLATPATEFNFKPDVMPQYPTADAGVKFIWNNYGKKDMPKTMGLDNIVPKFEHAPPLILDNIAKVQDGPFVATTITMMYLANPDTRAERIGLLQRSLAGQPDGLWWNQAKTLRERLLKIHQVSGKKILLFNYRLGDVNRQHDANLFLFQQVYEVAKSHDLLCVPVFVSVNKNEAEAIKDICRDAWVELYLPEIHYDKRYTAAFWTLVANDMSKEVFGLLGGRSGSMDIASFMGVNCCQWDEPICDPELSAIYEDQSYVSQNIDQCLRLFNQIYITSIIYLETKSMVKFEEGHGKFEKMTDKSKIKNCYARISEVDLVKWLTRPANITTPTIYPKFKTTPNLDDKMVVDITGYKNPNAFRNLVIGTFNKLENPTAKIRAVALREMGFEQVLLLPKEKSNYKRPAKTDKPDPANAKLLEQARAKEEDARAEANKAAGIAALKAMQVIVADDLTTPPSTSTLRQSNATLTPQDALVLQMGSDDEEDAGDFTNMDSFLFPDAK